MEPTEREPERKPVPPEGGRPKRNRPKESEMEQLSLTYNEELDKLGEELREWTYKPKPVKRVRIPKPGSNKERLLGVPCVRDRVLQYSMKLSLEERFEKKFSEHSYGFRPGRSQKQAVARGRERVKEGREWVVGLDLENFFDGLNHDRIIYLVRKEVEDNRVLRLIGLTLRSGVMEEGRYEPSREGTVQGSPLSPLLSNIVLHVRVVEAHIRARFRAQFMRNQKRRRYLVGKLIKQGTRRHTARKVVYSNDGIWRMSHSFASNLAWNIRWFCERGLEIVSDQKRPHWQSLDVRITLT